MTVVIGENELSPRISRESNHRRSNKRSPSKDVSTQADLKNRQKV